MISWIQKAEGVSFRHAVEILRDGRATTLLSSKSSAKVATIPKLPPPVSWDVDDQTLLNQVTDYYHKTLLEEPTGAAREYLKKRGLDHPEIATVFKLGYADRTLGIRLPDSNREAGAKIRERLVKLGVFRRESGHEHLRGSLVVPILDSEGNTLNLYGRKAREDFRENKGSKHLYLPGPHRGIWNPSCLQEKEIILCESLLDALSFWVNGLRNVTTSYGVEGFTEDMLSALIKSGVRRVFLAYDRDEAGDRAAAKLGGKLMGEGLECLRVLFPHGMDANEYILKVKPAEKSLRLLLHGAEWMGKKPESVDPPVAIPPQTVALPNGEHVDTQTGEVLPTSLAAEAPSLAAETLVAPQAAPLPYTLQGEDVHVSLSERSYRVRGLGKNLSYEVLKVNLRVSVGSLFHLDTLDFYSAKGRETFVTHAAREVEIAPDVLRRDMGRLLDFLEAMQAERIPAALKPKEPAAVRLTAEEEAEALACLRAPNLVGRIVADLTACGYVGEEVNKMAGYLVAVSRKLGDPLSVIIQSSSASGKSSLMEAVLAMVPPEDKMELSALTSQALFYMEKEALRHKLLAVAEDGGMAEAGYSLKNLITDKKLSKAAPGKDPQTGKMVTQTYEVEGPAAVMVSSTASEIESELKNRCLVLTLNEDKEQTEAILALQRFAQTLEGKKQKKRREAIRRLHHNAQRLLRRVEVINPFAVHLRFSAEQSRLRRDQMKYLGIMNALALLHQYQRPLKRDADAGEYVEVTLEDVAAANRLCAEVLGRTLDELAPQTRRLLNLLTAMVAAQAEKRSLDFSQVRLTRFDIRKALAWGHSQLAVHLSRLCTLEYLVVHRGGRGLFEYELLYRGEGDDGGRFVLGLIDVEELRKQVNGYNYESQVPGVNGPLPGVKEKVPGSFRGGSGELPAPFWNGQAHLSANNGKGGSERNARIPEKAHEEKSVRPHRNGAPYPKQNGAPAAAPKPALAAKEGR